MPKPTKGPRLGAGPAHERAILRGLSRSLILHGRIVTTEAKAKRMRPFVEKLITKARKGGVHERRLAMSEIEDKAVVHKLFSEVAPQTGDRPGGYTRIMKLGPRRGDATAMAIIELVDAPGPQAAAPVEEKPKRGRLRRRSRAAASEEETEAAAPEAEVAETEVAETEVAEPAPEAVEPAEAGAEPEPPAGEGDEGKETSS